MGVGSGRARRDGPATGEAILEAVEVGHGRLVDPPAEQHRRAGDDGGEIAEAGGEVLHEAAVPANVGEEPVAGGAGLRGAALGRPVVGRENQGPGGRVPDGLDAQHLLLAAPQLEEMPTGTPEGAAQKGQQAVGLRDREQLRRPGPVA